MEPILRRSALSLCLLPLCGLAQTEPEKFPKHSAEVGDIKLPNGKSQRDEILKAEHEQNIKDAAHLADLAEELKVELEKNDRFVLSVSTLKKTDESEKLARKIRSRLRR